jgi:molybdopterin converting factor small subunit
MRPKKPQVVTFENFNDIIRVNSMAIIVTLPASGECLDDLDQRFPGFKETMLDEKENIRETITIFLRGQNIRNLDHLSTAVQDDDEISIIPFLAGG